ncbi:MAG: hypothetical protein OXH68_15285 [Gammaproteobacteria bacterium]|nr:hypothetical protein [Gammaproteobacteria bacterium]
MTRAIAGFAMLFTLAACEPLPTAPDKGKMVGAVAVPEAGAVAYAIEQGTPSKPKRHQCRVVVTDSAETDVICHIREGAKIDVTDSNGKRWYTTSVDDNEVGRTVRVDTLFPDAAQTVTVHEHEDDRHVARARWKSKRTVTPGSIKQIHDISVGRNERKFDLPDAKDIESVLFFLTPEPDLSGEGQERPFIIWNRGLESWYTHQELDKVVTVHYGNLDDQKYNPKINWHAVLKGVTGSYLSYFGPFSDNGYPVMLGYNGLSAGDPPRPREVRSIRVFYTGADIVTYGPAEFRIDWDGTTVEGGVHLRVGFSAQPPSFGTDFNRWKASDISNMITERCRAAPSRSVTLQPADFASGRVRLQWRNDQSYGTTAEVTCAQINAGKP